MNLGFVGNGADKFDQFGESRAQDFIKDLLYSREDIKYVVSGHSPVGGIDIWAEIIAEYKGFPTLIFEPKIHQWNPPGKYGYKARNLDIAKNSDILYVMVASDYPDDYTGRRFEECYHCKSIGRPFKNHVKSGGCWTGKKALEMGNKVIWIRIDNG